MSADLMLRNAILLHLRAVPGADASRVMVTVFNGVAMLSGDVDTPEDKAFVERVVRSVLALRGLVQGLQVIDRRTALA